MSAVAGVSLAVACTFLGVSVWLALKNLRASSDADKRRQRLIVVASVSGVVGWLVITQAALFIGKAGHRSFSLVLVFVAFVILLAAVVGYGVFIRGQRREYHRYYEENPNKRLTRRSLALRMSPFMALGTLGVAYGTWRHIGPTIFWSSMALVCFLVMLWRHQGPEDGDKVEKF